MLRFPEHMMILILILLSTSELHLLLVRIVLIIYVPVVLLMTLEHVFMMFKVICLYLLIDSLRFLNVRFFFSIFGGLSVFAWFLIIERSLSLWFERIAEWSI